MVKQGLVEYLRSNGNVDILETFCKEAHLKTEAEKKFCRLLEQKWNTVKRVQIKLMKIEAKLAEVKKEIIEGELLEAELSPAE